MENKRQRNLYLIIAFFFKSECVSVSKWLWIMNYDACICLNAVKWITEDIYVE